MIERTPFADFTGGLSVAAVSQFIYAGQTLGSPGAGSQLATYWFATDGTLASESFDTDRINPNAQGFRLGVRDNPPGIKALVTGTRDFGVGTFGEDYLGGVWVG